MKPLNTFLDHTLLKPDATEKQIDQLIEEAMPPRFAAVCINPRWVERAAKALKGHKIAICTVVGFPLGANLSEIKQKEASLAIEQGATELDIVISIGALKSARFDEVEKEIASIVELSPTLLVKVILETCYLTREEIIKGCLLTQGAGAHFVKTSTGFGPR